LQFGERNPDYVYIPRYNLPPVHLKQIAQFDRQRVVKK